ncbi:partial adenylate cyclase, partial [Patescibacteria group bacterium]
MIKSYKRTFKVDLLTCFIGLILFTVIIVVYSYHVNSKNSLNLAKELVNTTLNHAVSETKQYLSTAQYTPALTSILLSPDLNILHDANLEQRIIDVLKQSPFLFMYYIGDEQGNFILGYKNKYHSISTKLINNQDKKPFSLLRYRDDKNTVYEEKKQAVDYDPRTRPWYIGSKYNNGFYWTEVYPFFTKEPDIIYSQTEPNQAVYGVSVSTPILNNKKQFIGAVGVDISLVALSDFLRTLKIGENGKALIVNNQRQLILFPWENSVKLLKGMKVEDIENDWLKAGVQDFFKNYEKEFFYIHNNQHYFVKAFDFSKEIGKDWYLVIVVPVDDFLGEAKQARLVSFLITSMMLLCSILLSLLLSKTLSRPIEKMTHTMRQVKALDFSDLKHLTSPIREFQEMSDTLTSMTQGLKAFLKYVPPEVVAELIKKGENVTLGGQEMNLTLFFSDIEDFTQITEETAPMELMEDLTYYFDQMVKVIVLQYQGTIDKYIGDSVMAFWGAPSFTTEHALLACHAALMCQKEIAHLNAQRLVEGKTIF